MATLPPSDVRYVLSQDLRLALLVALLLAVGSRVSLEDDFNVSVTAAEDWPAADLQLVEGGVP